MKRHNILLVAYIVFTIICLVVRSFVEFETWGYIVSAVAISSALLAYADFFYINAKHYSDSCEMAERFIIDRKKKVETEHKITEDICTKIAELKAKNIDVTQEEANFKTAKNGYLEVEKFLEEFVGSTTKKRKKQKKYSFIADILTFLAFLSFLCLIAFTNIAEAIGKAQDIISIIAFVIVLSSQYVNSIFSDEYRKERKRHDHAVETHDLAHEHIFEVQNNFNIYYEKVKSYAD